MEPAPPGSPPRQGGFFCLVHRQPVVLAAADWEVDPAAALWGVLAALPRQKAYLLVQPSWVVDESFPHTPLRGAIQTVRESFEHVEPRVLAPTAHAFEIVQADGVAALYCSQNAFVREDIFFPMPGRRQTFDVIYDAKWADYKRHHLAAAVESLALLTYQVTQDCDCTLEYFQKALSAVRHATWFTRPWVASDPFLAPPEVNAIYNRCRVGLCLSAEEGANYSSIQYLLAGLPVVTTANIGGRDEFFSTTTARWVEDDPRAVADAVADLCAHPVDPLAIRHETLGKIDEHRQRVRQWMCSIVDAEGAGSRRWFTGWPADVPHKLNDDGLSVPHDTVAPRVVLTDEDRERFEGDGFLIVDQPLFVPEELEVVHHILDELLERFDELPTELAYDLGDTKLHDGRQEIPEINRALEIDPRLGETAAFARCQELAHQLLSGRAFCNFDHAIFKPPSGNDTTVHWHQDLAYAPERELADEVHIWLALQDVDEANGCMRYVPTGGRAGLVPHHRGSALTHALVADEVDIDTAVSCPLSAGMATVHRPATLHSTGPNTTDRIRVAWILHFVDNGP